MQYGMRVQGEYLFIPVQKGKEWKRLEIFDSVGTKYYEFRIPCCNEPSPDYNYDYKAQISIKELAGKEIRLVGDFPESFFMQMESGFLEKSEKSRFRFHFAPRYGWINDPNGLVYADEVYHLYFQYNPFDVRWENMSWGHAISTDLLTWEQRKDVLYPDASGTMFSGCGLKNEKGLLGLPEDALLFYYTAAGGASTWSEGKLFTQKMAYSTDGGENLVKREEIIIDTICGENRDPKIFWHSATSAYICALWLEKNDYGIFRSTDLKEFTMSQRLTLQDAWECPDLFCLSSDTGEQHWVFWTADGFYFVGEFDGYVFTPTQERQEAYIGKGFYAAQSYSGIEDRSVQIPWLRMENYGENYTGAMGLARELRLCRKDGVWKICQKPISEFTGKLMPVDKPSDAVYMSVSLQDGINEELRVKYLEEELVYNPKKEELCLGSARVTVPGKYRSMELVMDDKILEVSFDDGIMIGGFVLQGIAKMQSYDVSNQEAEVTLYTLEAE